MFKLNLNQKRQNIENFIASSVYIEIMMTPLDTHLLKIIVTSKNWDYRQGTQEPQVTQRTVYVKTREIYDKQLQN